MKSAAILYSDFLLPPNLLTQRGTKRRVGFELEFSGLGIFHIAAVIIKVFGGTVRQQNPYKLLVENTQHGTFCVVFDFRLLRETVLKEKLGELGFTAQEDLDLIELFEEVLATLSETIVPYEIITPPIPIDRLGVIETLQDELRLQGALGTGALLFYAFGLHINPEVPSFETASILNHLRAFLLLYEWIVERSNTDMLRRMSPYIHPFDKEYALLVLNPRYQPDRSRLISDYLLFNPTRNRPLDLLPLFMYLDEKRVKATVRDPKVKPRPTFHYRLPDCRIDEADQSVSGTWNYWVEVEKLACNEERIRAMSSEYREYLEDPFAFFDPDWPQRVAMWLR